MDIQHIFRPQPPSPSPNKTKRFAYCSGFVKSLESCRYPAASFQTHWSTARVHVNVKGSPRHHDCFISEAFGRAGDVALGFSPTLNVRATSRSPSGLFSTFSRVNRFIAEIGRQLRIVTRSSCRNSIILNEYGLKHAEVTYD